MTHHLRALAALPEAPGSRPAHSWWLTTAFNSSSTGSTALYRECMNVVHKHTFRQQTYTSNQ